MQGASAGVRDSNPKRLVIDPVLRAATKAATSIFIRRGVLHDYMLACRHAVARYNSIRRASREHIHINIFVKTPGRPPKRRSFLTLSPWSRRDEEQNARRPQPP